MDSLQHEILVINLQSEEIIFVNTQGSKNFNALSSFKKHSVDDLGTIVQNYQQGDSLAAEQLRQKFYPLISKLSHRHSMYSIFGEDAENMAWLLFYEFVYDYKGNDFKRLPGLIRRFLIFRLLRLMEQQGTRWDTEEHLESETFVDVATECEQIQNFLNDTALQEEILRLPEREMQAVKEFYFKNHTYTESARNMNCTPRNVRYYKGLALSRLRNHFKT